MNNMKPIVLLGLKQIPFFINLSGEALNALADKAKPVKFAKGEVIITEGEQTQSLYIVISGEVKVLTHYGENKNVDLVILEPGYYFGEMSLLTNDPRSATVTALHNTTCAVISKPDFKNWLAAHPNIEINLLNVLAEKVEYMTEKTHQMELSIIYEKTVKVLTAMAEPKGHKLIIEKLPTTSELADLVGAKRRLVSIVLKELIKNKHLSTRGAGTVSTLSNNLPEAW